MFGYSLAQQHLRLSGRREVLSGTRQDLSGLRARPQRGPPCLHQPRNAKSICAPGWVRGQRCLPRRHPVPAQTYFRPFVARADRPDARAFVRSRPETVSSRLHRAQQHEVQLLHERRPPTRSARSAPPRLLHPLATSVFVDHIGTRPSLRHACAQSLESSTVQGPSLAARVLARSRERKSRPFQDHGARRSDRLSQLVAQPAAP